MEAAGWLAIQQRRCRGVPRPAASAAAIFVVVFCAACGVTCFLLLASQFVNLYFPGRRLSLGLDLIRYPLRQRRLCLQY